MYGSICVIGCVIFLLSRLRSSLCRQLRLRCLLLRGCMLYFWNSAANGFRRRRRVAGQVSCPTHNGSGCDSSGDCCGDISCLIMILIRLSRLAEILLADSHIAASRILHGHIAGSPFGSIVYSCVPAAMLRIGSDSLCRGGHGYTAL